MSRGSSPTPWKTARRKFADDVSDSVVKSEQSKGCGEASLLSTEEKVLGYTWGDSTEVVLLKYDTMRRYKFSHYGRYFRRFDRYLS